jgi:hypothetical protein
MHSISLLRGIGIDVSWGHVGFEVGVSSVSEQDGLVFEPGMRRG